MTGVEASGIVDRVFGTWEGPDKMRQWSTAGTPVIRSTWPEIVLLRSGHHRSGGHGPAEMR